MKIETEVAIVGCGPTGAVLANLLGALGVNVVVIEKESEVFPIPRATHIDEETKFSQPLRPCLRTDPFRRFQEC